MSTHTSIENTSNKTFQHYKSLNDLEDNLTKPADWENAKPFESIPGPKPAPLIGNAWRFFLPKFGDFFGLDIVDIQKKIRARHGDVAILKGLVGLEPLVFLFNPADIEKLIRNEGIWPVRNGLPSFAEYRKHKKNILESGGLVTLQGEDWFKFRTVVNPILMQPKNVLQYADKMNTVADELIDNIRYFSKQNEQGQMPDNFLYELYKWSLESIGVITMDKRLGCLKLHEKNVEAEKLMTSVLKMFDLMYKLDVLPSLWKVVSTPAWKEYVKTLDFLVETNLKYIKKYIEKIEHGEIDCNSPEANSALYQLIQVDKTVAVAMAVDMMIAGVDTTGRILGACLYYLSKNPEKQKILQEEAKTLLGSKDSPVTPQLLSKASYTKAVIKETTRLSPIAIGNLRTMKKNLVLGGYQIPTGTNVLACSLLLCRQEKHYPRPNEFLPERWSSPGELSHKNTNPFVFAPFGIGPRSCVGKRLANLELETALLKISRNFQLEWPHEDMVFSTTSLHGIARPLKIHMKEEDY